MAGSNEDRATAPVEAYRLLFEHADNMVCTLDLEGRFTSVNRAGEKLTGYRADDLEGRLAVELIAPELRDEAVRQFRRRLQNRSEYGADESILLTREGRRVPIEISSVLYSESGRPSGVLGLIHDLTERKRAARALVRTEAERDRLRDELSEAQKLEAVGRLAAGVAHDFNNMLTAIRGYSDLLLDRLNADDVLPDEAGQLRRAVEQAAVLPRQLLAFGRRQTLEPELVDLNELVSSTAALLRHLVSEAVEVMTRPTATKAHAFVDRAPIQHALVNLALNARDAMPDGGTLTITTANAELDAARAVDNDATPGSYVVISVSDTGHGMDAETKARAFEPFFTTKPPGRGAGLGLASAYGSVTQSGGFIRLTTEPGRGATFDIHLPCAEPLPAVDGGAAGRPVVLLAEDEPIVRELAVSVLERAGLQVHAATTGAEARDLYEELRGAVDVLVTDMAMPGVGGRELAEQLLDLDPQVPIVFMSGYTDDAPPDPEAGAAVAFLQKPFSSQELVGGVRQVLAERSASTSSPLTRREREVLCLVADGLTNERVAASLAISPETVQTHVRNAMAKLEADTRTQAVATALRQSLIT